VGSGDADFDVADDRGRVEVPPEDPSYTIQRLHLSDRELSGYYYGYSNQVLWPLCHGMPTRASFDAEFWQYYTQVNETFADAIVTCAEDDDPVVWFQDYHLALAPRLVREQLPNAFLTHFWHIPWPAWDTFRSCPEHHELLEGLLANDLLGFHSETYCEHFCECVAAVFEDATVDADAGLITYEGHTTRVQSQPLGVDADVHAERAGAEETEELWETFSSRHALGEKVAVGVDRLDYTKGILQRLDALEWLWEHRPDRRGELTYVQKGSESRTQIDEYQELQDEVERRVREINDRFATAEWTPVVYTKDHYSRAGLTALYRHADVALVSPLRDGDEPRRQGVRGLPARRRRRARALGVRGRRGVPGRRRAGRQPERHRGVRDDHRSRALDARADAEAADAGAPPARARRGYGRVGDQPVHGHPRRPRRRGRVGVAELAVSSGLGLGPQAVAGGQPPAGRRPVRDDGLRRDGRRHRRRPGRGRDTRPGEGSPGDAGGPPRAAVAVVSGRAVEDVRERAGVEDAYCAGNHGLELHDGNERSVHSAAHQVQEVLPRVCDAVERVFAGDDGVIVEDKGVTATVHYRQADVDREAVQEAVEAALDDHDGYDALRITEGKQIVELRPDVDWGRGLPSNYSGAVHPRRRAVADGLPGRRHDRRGGIRGARQRWRRGRCGVRHGRDGRAVRRERAAGGRRPAELVRRGGTGEPRRGGARGRGRRTQLTATGAVAA